MQLAETNIRHELYLNTLKDNCIDLIYSSHSLEHVSDVDETLQEFKEVLKPGGYIFLEVPNADHPEDGPQMGKNRHTTHVLFSKKVFIENFDIKFIETLNMDRFNVKNWRNNIEENGRIIVTLMQLKIKN